MLGLIKAELLVSQKRKNDKAERKDLDQACRHMHASNPSTRESVRATGSLSLRPA